MSPPPSPPAQILVLRFAYLAILIGFCAAVLARSLPKPSDETVIRWARKRGLKLTPENGYVVSEYVRRTRRAKATGTVIGIVLATTIRSLWAHPAWLGNPVTMAVAGFLLGAIGAEVSMRAANLSATRMALLSPRAMNDYLPGWFRWSLIAVTGLVAGVAGWLALDRQPLALGGGNISVPVPSVIRSATCNGGGHTYAYIPATAVTLLATAGVCISATLMAIAVLRLAVSRAQPLDSQDALEADDVVRSASAAAAVSAALGLALLTLSGLLGQVALRVNVPCQTIVPLRLVQVASAASMLAALLAWLWLSRRAWPRRQPAPSREAMSAP